jgi:hypothetical protein
MFVGKIGLGYLKHKMTFTTVEFEEALILALPPQKDGKLK